MGRHQCNTCESLKQYYWLKFNQFVLAGRSSSGSLLFGHTVDEEQLAKLKDESLEALTALMRHAKVCYGLEHDTRDEAA